MTDQGLTNPSVWTLQARHQSSVQDAAAQCVAAQYPAIRDCSSLQPTTCQADPIENSDGSFSYTSYMVGYTLKALV